jgi:hypothetical protein
MQVDTTFIKSGEYMHSQVNVRIHSDRRIVDQPRERRRNQQPWGQIKPEDAYTLLPLLLMIGMLSWIVVGIFPNCQHNFFTKKKKCLHRWLFLFTKAWTLHRFQQSLLHLFEIWTDETIHFTCVWGNMI